MSGIGPSNIGALNIAGLIAGSQRTNAGDDRIKADAANQKFKVDQKTLTSQSLDVAEADLSADRDPDGRLPYGEPPQPDETADGTAHPHSHPQTSDPSGERGNALDLEA